MSTHFIPFKIPVAAKDDASTLKKDPPIYETAEKVQTPHFALETDSVTLATAEKKQYLFRVHPLVASHMGLEEKEAARAEAYIQRELERRWIEAKEKAEVEGYTTGLNTGKREAYNAERPRIEEKLRKLDTLLIEFDKMRELIFVKNEDFLAKLMSQLLRIIVLKEIDLDKDYLRRLVMHLISQLSDKDDLIITISETDQSNLQVLREAIDKKFGELKNLKLMFSSEVKAGSCRVEAKTVAIDASIEQQIRNATKILYDEKQVAK